jgi:hypothetical protein
LKDDVKSLDSQVALLKSENQKYSGLPGKVKAIEDKLST